MHPHTLRATLLSSGSKGFAGGRIVPLGLCGAAFSKWHFPDGVPNTEGDAAVLRPGKVTVCRKGLCAMLFPRIDSVVLFLTPWQTFWNVLPSAGQTDVKDGPSPVLPLGVTCTVLHLGFHTRIPSAVYALPALDFTNPGIGDSHSPARKFGARRLLHSAVSAYILS